jgi:hypothetical protein
VLLEVEKAFAVWLAEENVFLERFAVEILRPAFARASSHLARAMKITRQ